MSEFSADNAPDGYLKDPSHERRYIAKVGLGTPMISGAAAHPAWSFHAMDAPLDVWIDDLVVDTKPVACPQL